ncbi:MAG: ATP-binding protein, partial [Candidatus Omnitrophota bacterium]|nr:ATP-binding protein [Candidatus Omnitrophota bacterium]
MQDYKDEKLASLEKEMRLIDAAVVVPSFVEEKLLGFIVLGEKISGKIYSQDDLSVFSVLANQAALAIENAMFYEQIKETQSQLFQAEKMATIGTMANGLSHQISNRLHALGLIAADTMDALNMAEKKGALEDVHELLAKIKYAMERIQDNVKQGGEVVRGLLKYSRPGEAGFEPINFDALIRASLEMVQYKVRLSEIDFVRDYHEDLPKIKGNFTQLQEVFFNLIDNAYDATVQRKQELNEENYKGKITVSCHANVKDGFLEIRFEDNGIGVAAEDNEKLFTPFFTTKTSSKKGTGLGLYVIQKIITANHHGKIHFESEYKKGTTFIIELSVA